jgi:hypothetical protein
MNKYMVKCPGCANLYIDKIIDGLSKLLHTGYDFGDPQPNLPTPQCIAYFDYVKFLDCQHCCPETFAVCPECDTSTVGKPSEEPCRC